MGRCAHDFHLHQAACGFLRIGERLFDNKAITGVQRIEDLILLGLIKVFNQINNIIRLKIAHRIGQFSRAERVNHFFTQVIAEFRQDIPVHSAFPQGQQIGAVTLINLFHHVGDVSGVQRV